MLPAFGIMVSGPGATLELICLKHHATPMGVNTDGENIIDHASSNHLCVNCRNNGNLWNSSMGLVFICRNNSSDGNRN